MFSKKKESKRAPTSNDPYGFDLMSNFDSTNMEDDNDDVDDDLEAELHKLMINDDSIRSQRPARKLQSKSINSEITDNVEIESDEELSGDDDDPELLSELNEMMVKDELPKTEKNSSTEETSCNNNTVDQQEIIQLLEDRLELYKTAELTAKNSNEITKSRRFIRGIKTLQGMLHDAKAGKNVDSADIPPLLPRSATQVSDYSAEQGQDSITNLQEAIIDPNPPENLDSEQLVLEPKTSDPIFDPNKLELLKQRQQEYRIAAVNWKKSGNIEEAIKLVKIAKQFEVVIAALTSGQPVDLSDMPPLPQQPLATISTDSSLINEGEKIENKTQEKSENVETVQNTSIPITGNGITGALKERLEIYRRTKITAEEEGNSSKARRYGRICKQYEDAIKLYTRGKPIPVEELPVPPGFPPIVTDTPALAPIKEKELPETIEVSKISLDDEKPSSPPHGKKKSVTGIVSRAQKQTLLLQKRQAELKRAALTAKKDGDLELARDYLRKAKGMDPLIQASNSGLPIDMTSIPLSPNAQMQLENESININLSDGFALISSDDCQLSDATGTDVEINENLEKLLIKQKKVCLATRDHCKALGDVPGYNRWERMALGYSRDLDMLRVRKRNGLSPPQHHYEEKTHAIVKSCTDLTDSDLEISIIRGVNYPKEADTYVIYEFPYPSDRLPSDRTLTIRNTCNPEYDATFTLLGSIDRSSRPCQRAFKRHALKCQVWSKGGFLRSDSLLGTVTIKLQPLETQCILHDSFPLMNGRKAVGGKLEVKLRLRNPITTKQIEKMTDRWLVIDN